MVLGVLQDKLYDQLYVRDTGGIMGSDLGTLTWAQSVLEPAGLDFPSADVVQEAKGLQTDLMAAQLKLREAAHSITHSLCLPSLQCQCSELPHNNQIKLFLGQFATHAILESLIIVTYLVDNIFLALYVQFKPCLWCIYVHYDRIAIILLAIAIILYFAI